MGSFSQGLAILPDELILLIFDNILKITDKRQFLKTCKKYNNLTKDNFLQYENNYSIVPFCKIHYYCVEKFTLELCYDGYFDLIPDYYIIENNRVIVEAALTFNGIKILEIIKKKGSPVIYDKVCFVAATTGNLELLKWGKDNGFMVDINICNIAASNGHLDVVKWALDNGYEQI